jgi:D-alanyl-lipoteichoic acid acyltransferase DltB (MBOAT superfamily)
LIFALYAFSIQIYMDLSGYTDMARGTARLLGYDLPENFRTPYAATSVGNFWQRWHITMSSFFRDYLFFSLGGSRRGNVYVNVVITFVAIGIWHDAGWNFVVYGLCHGGLVAFERFRHRRREALGRPPVVPTWWSTVTKIAFVFSFVSFTRVLFRGDSLESATGYLAAIATAPGDLVPPVWLGYAAALLGLALHYLPPARRQSWRDRFGALPSVVQAAIAVVVIYAAVAVSEGTPGFIYFQF